MHTEGCGIIRIPPPDSDVDAANGAIGNLVDLSGTFFDEIFVFDYTFADDDQVTCIPLEKTHSLHPLFSILTHISFQYRLCQSIWKQREELDVTFWHAGGFSLLFPLLLTKLLGIDVLLFVLGEPRKGYQHRESGGLVKRRIIPKLLFVLEVLSFVVCDRIIVFNDSILDYSVLEQFKNKTSQLRFNFEEIPESVEPEDCGTTLIYIGRICELKGAGDFAKAANRLFSRENIDIDEILFVGEGPTKERWEQYFADTDAGETVTFTGWLSHEEAMEKLEASKIMVLPSKSEGLPKTLIEAMARGVIPVATPVGNISDVITDGEDGVLLGDTAPETIADTIETLVTESDLDKMAYRSHETAQEQFSYQIARDDFKTLLTELK